MAMMATDLALSLRVLLVDDHDDTREGYSLYLRHLGAQVAAAANGLEAVEAARAVLPDVVVTDLTMPGMDGWEVVRALRADRRTRSVPVIAMTAHVLDGSGTARALAAGFDGFCRKPCRPSDLVRTIHAVIDGERSRVRASTQKRMSPEGPILRPSAIRS
jgi:two-component system cell cycle response regulator DivK